MSEHQSPNLKGQPDVRFARLPGLILMAAVLFFGGGISNYLSGERVFGLIGISSALVAGVLVLAMKRPGINRYAPEIMMVLITIIVLASAYFRPIPGFLWIFAGVLGIFQLAKPNIALVFSLCLSALVVVLVDVQMPEAGVERLPASILAVCLVCYLGAFKVEKREIAIIAQQAELEAANQAQKEFIDNISHEMRTPLTAIKGFSELIAEDQELTRVSQRYIETVLYNTIQLSSMINDLIETTRLQSVALRAQPKEVDLAQLLSGILSTENPTAQDLGLELTISPQFPLPKYIHTDASRLTQVLINLTSNALKFTPNGYVDISVNYKQSANTIEFIVRDTGIGIAADFQEQIFERFSQQNIAESGDNRGLGLGLYISKQLTLLLGGTLSYRPASPGSEFSVELKLSDVCDELIYNLDTESTHAGQVKTERPTYNGHVLVAEDSVTNQLLIGMLLDNYGVTHSLVENGQQALDSCKNSSYDLVLMDINMPVMSGIEAALGIKELGLDIPVVALSASAVTSRADDAETRMFDGLLGKPIDTLKLDEILAQHLTRKEPAAA